MNAAAGCCCGGIAAERSRVWVRGCTASAGLGVHIKSCFRLFCIRKRKGIEKGKGKGVKKSEEAVRFITCNVIDLCYQWFTLFLEIRWTTSDEINPRIVSLVLLGHIADVTLPRDRVVVQS